MDRRGFLLAATSSLPVAIAGCLFGGDGSGDRDALAEYITFDHWFEHAYVGIDLRLFVENRTDDDFNVIASPEVYIDDKQITSDTGRVSLDPGGSGELAVPIIIEGDELDLVTHYVLSLTVSDYPVTLTEYEEEFDDFQARLES